MSENLYSKNQRIMSGHGKSGFDRIFRHDTEYIFANIGFDRAAAAPIGVEVIKNPTRHDYARIRKVVAGEHPRSEEPKLRAIWDSLGNQYIWRADHATHVAVADLIEKKFGVDVGKDYDIERRRLIWEQKNRKEREK
jgi:hypothetical protein